jgi:hypothetical protein
MRPIEVLGRQPTNLFYSFGGESALSENSFVILYLPKNRKPAQWPAMMDAGMQWSTWQSGGTFKQLLRLAFEFEPFVLMGLSPCQRGDPLHEIENRFRWSALLVEDSFDDLSGFNLRETATA